MGIVTRGQRAWRALLAANYIYIYTWYIYVCTQGQFGGLGSTAGGNRVPNEEQGRCKCRPVQFSDRLGVYKYSAAGLP